MRNPVPALLAALCGALLSTAPRAAELETVVVTATRDDTSLSDVPVSVSALSGEDLRLIGAVHASEALARVPGTWISRGNG